MSTAFVIPDWLPRAPSEPAQPLDEHRIEGLINQFIAGKQEALFTAPDAFYRLEGADAVNGRPAIDQRLQTLRDATLEQARDDGERAALGPRLELHIGDATDGIDRHVKAQQLEHQRQIIAERQALIRRSAELEYDNDDKISGLAEAHASAAEALARLNGEPEDAAVAGARSGFWRSVLDRHISNGDGARALTLFDRVADQLGPADRLSLDTPLQVARNDESANQWIARETATDGPPLQERAAADPALSPDVKLIIRAKVAALESAEESKRVAEVMGLDDAVRDSLRTLPTGAYKLGAFARLSEAYTSAGETQRAAYTRQLALQEPFLLAFVRARPDLQQQLIDSLPPEDRVAAQAVQREQFGDGLSDATINAYRASPSSSHSPDVTGSNAETERLLDVLYEVDRKSTEGNTEDNSNLLHQVQDIGDNKRQGKAGEDAEAARIKEIDPRAKIARQICVYVDGGPKYMVADIVFKGNGTSLVVIEVKTGNAELTPNQIKVLAEAVRTGRVYITNTDFAKTTGIETNKTFGAQRILPEIYIVGGNSAKIERQMRAEGIDVRPAGVRGRMRLGIPPS